MSEKDLACPSRRGRQKSVLFVLLMNEEKNLPEVSVIIPAYKEGERIGRTLLEIKEYFARTGKSYEILVVVDGSPDNTAEVVRNYAEKIPQLRLIENKENHGKGYVVRQGLL
ncbi:MAG TPA: glycosyltransferase family 2 protein, partial [Candidatus Moranbacteria bacterium]|nr:glycosyltransferase family 2 protein [Candidatus Moranbacteria bacterium]